MSQELEQKIEELRLQRGRLRDLLTHPGWVAIKGAIEGLVRARRNAVFSAQLTSLDAVFQMQANVHEAAGLLLATKLPEMVLEDLDRDHESLLEQQREQAAE